MNTPNIPDGDAMNFKQHVLPRVHTGHRFDADAGLIVNSEPALPDSRGGSTVWFMESLQLGRF